jgi:hypothetical protein
MRFVRELELSCPLGQMSTGRSTTKSSSVVARATRRSAPDHRIVVDLVIVSEIQFMVAIGLRWGCRRTDPTGPW